MSTPMKYIITLCNCLFLRWLEQMKTVMDTDTLQGDETVSWSAYHAGLQPPDVVPDSSVAITCMLPLFYDQAKSVAMIRHSMDVVKKAVEILNPGQVPIITVDQPLYTIAKQIQWCWPATHGEDHFIVMFGGLHIEMAALKTLGDLLEGSGWTGALVQAGVATPGTADSLLKASHVTRTRRAHQVTASSLYLLLQKAYAEYSADLDEGAHPLSLEDWCSDRAAAHPQAHFWSLILQLELEVMIYVRAVREADFLLYVDALTKIVPWFFALGHTHYARWIPVHLRDMIALKDAHPEVHAQFLKGNFVVKKTTHRFSAIAIDQAHEQNNATVKGDGGAVGLTENPSALRRWMVSGPEMARLIGEFEASTEKRKETDTRHHEQTRHAQMAFARDVKALTGAIEDMGNPFCENSSDLLVLDSRDLADAAVIDTVNQIEKLGQDQYEAYVSERLVNQTKNITDPIKRNNLPLFSRPPIREKTRSQQQLSSMKNDCSLFSRLYIAAQIRDGDLDEFFEHENQACPPALSQLGKLRAGTKSDLVGCLEDLVPAQEDAPNPAVQVSILDGAAIVNMLQPGAAKTFADYAKHRFSPYIKSQLQHVNRVDVVWDEYIPESLKAQTRSKRGKGIRRRVEPSSAIPGNWQQFLRIDENKVELFSFLATSVTAIDTDSEKQIISTHHAEVICTQPREVSGLAPCTHEEADTRILLHVEDAVKEGYRKVSVRTVDTDVLVLAVTAAQRLNIDELWVAFGVGKSFRHLAAHEMARALGPDKCIALPMFHAFTGCDNVSFFGGRGKKTAWDTWKAFDDVTPAFCTLAATPDSVDDSMKPLERFVVLLYDRTSSQDSVNQARKQLFTQKGRTIDGIPPTQAALIQHTKRAAYQAGYCWAQMMVAAPKLPSPGDWGWNKKDTGGWDVCWTTLPEAIKACHELLRCGCKKGCRRQCKCVKAALQCTALCHCGGLCSHN